MNHFLAVTRQRMNSQSWNFVAAVLLAALSLAAVGCTPSSAPVESGGNLSPQMSQLQHFHDKLAFAVQAKNPRLAIYYAEEVQEQLGWISDRFPEHEGWPVGKLITDLTSPKLEPVTEAITLRDWDGAERAVAALTSTCNSCHAATDRDFLVILSPGGTPPYSQDFELP